MVQSDANDNEEGDVSHLRDIDAAEKARRRWRTENGMSSVNHRRNRKNRKAEAEQSNTKRGSAWKRDSHD